MIWSKTPLTGRVGFERLSYRMAGSNGDPANLDAKIPAHAKMLIASDFLEAPDVWRQRLSRLASRPVSGALLHIIDPAEESFPYKGRLEMRLPNAVKSTPFIVGRAERAQAEYQQKFAAHCQALEDTAKRLGWTLIRHRTDKPATEALTALYLAISGQLA